MMKLGRRMMAAERAEARAAAQGYNSSYHKLGEELLVLLHTYSMVFDVIEGLNGLPQGHPN